MDLHVYLYTVNLDKLYSAAAMQVQLLSKVSTPLHDEPLDSTLNVIHGIGYSSRGTAWIIDLMIVS